LKPNTAEEIRIFQQGKHYDKHLECVILGACLLEPKAFSRIYNLLEEDFLFDNFNKIVFSALKEMFEAGDMIDLITVAHHLRKKKITEFGDDNVPYLLTGLMEPVVTTAHLEPHCLILRELYVERMLQRVAHSEFDGDALEKTIHIQAEIKRALSVQGTDDWQSIGDVMIALEKHRVKVKDKELMGVPTGFNTLDRITGGLQGGQIIVLGARPSVGKSAFIGGIAVNAAQNKFKVGVISLEMPLEQIELNTKIKTKEIVKALVKFEKDDKIMYAEGWIIVKNFTKHQSEGTKVKIAIESELKRLPKRIRDTLSTMPDMVSVLGAYTVLNPTIPKDFKKGSGDSIEGIDLDVHSPTYGLRVVKSKP